MRTVSAIALTAALAMSAAVACDEPFVAGTGGSGSSNSGGSSAVGGNPNGGAGQGGGGDWVGNWARRLPLTLTYDGPPLTRFPVAVVLTRPAHFANIQDSAAKDVQFVDTAGNVLEHEIESFDRTTGSLIAWVVLPIVDGNVDFLMYFGDATAAGPVDPTKVWSDYHGVWHFADRLGTAMPRISDSSPSGAHGDIIDALAEVDGVAGQAHNVELGSVEIPDPGFGAELSTDSFCWSMWIRIDTPANYTNMPMFRQGNDSNGGTFDGLMLRTAATVFDEWRITFDADGHREASFTAPPDTSWHVVTAVVNREANTLVALLDGALGGMATLPPGQALAMTGPLFVGEYIPGSVDELRLRKGLIGTSWAKLVYDNMTAPDHLLTVGPLESR